MKNKVKGVSFDLRKNVVVLRVPLTSLSLVGRALSSFKPLKSVSRRRDSSPRTCSRGETHAFLLGGVSVRFIAGKPSSACTRSADPAAARPLGARAWSRLQRHHDPPLFGVPTGPSMRR